MAKNKNNLVYFCKECGYESTKWLGQCPSCKSWDTFVEEEKISEKSNDIFTEISKKPDIIPKTITIIPPPIEIREAISNLFHTPVIKIQYANWGIWPYTCPSIYLISLLVIGLFVYDLEPEYSKKKIKKY